MKARAQRAQAQGINEADLPAVPKSITDPPPLPPPEVHRKDTPGGRAAKVTRKGKAGASLKRVAGKRGSAKARARAASEEEETSARKPKAVASKKKARSGKSAKPGKRAPAPKSGSGHRVAKRGRGGKKGKA